jgi:hypothetical protein
MPIETKDKEIDGRAVKVSQFPGRRGLSHLTRLVKIVGPAIGALVGKTSGAVTMDTEVSVDGAVRALMEQLDAQGTVDFVMELLSCTRLDGKEIKDAVFDMEFAGNYMLLAHILTYVLEVNYSSFFGPNGIGNLVEKVQQVTSAKSLTGSTPASEQSGQSGG